MKLFRVTCCLFILLLSLLAFTFVPRSQACAGYMGHLFIKSESRASTIALISHSLL
jgi:hypothetical protein